MVIVEDKFKAMCQIYGKNFTENLRYVNYEEFENKLSNTDFFLTEDNLLFHLSYFFPTPSSIIFLENQLQTLPITLDFFIDYNLKRANISPFENLYLVRPYNSNFIDCVSEEQLKHVPYIYFFSRKLTDTELDIVNHCVEERITRYIDRLKKYYTKFKDNLSTFIVWKSTKKKRAYKK